MSTNYIWCMCGLMVSNTIIFAMREEREREREMTNALVGIHRGESFHLKAIASSQEWALCESFQ